MNASVRAWRLDWTSQPIALALCEVVEVVDEPEIHAAPCGPEWCCNFLYWRDHLLPLAGTLEHDGSVVVVAYQHAPGAPLRHAAFAIRGKPRQIDVIDGNDCELPMMGLFDEVTAHACFEHEGVALVVPKLEELFAANSS